MTKPNEAELLSAFNKGRKQGMLEAAAICKSAPDFLQDTTFDGAANAIRAAAEKIEV